MSVPAAGSPWQSDLSEALAAVRASRALPTPADRAAIRRMSGLSQEDLARILGVNRSTLARWELGTLIPPAEIAERYLELLRRLVVDVVTHPEDAAGP